MAIYPCDVKAHRYPGPQRTIYLAFVDGIEAERHKFRLCKTHFELALTALKEFVFDGDMADVPDRCARCDSPAPRGALYATVYDHGADREDFYAPLCDQHGSVTLEGLGMTF